MNPTAINHSFETVLKTDKPAGHVTSYDPLGNSHRPDFTRTLRTLFFFKPKSSSPSLLKSKYQNIIKRSKTTRVQTIYVRKIHTYTQYIAWISRKTKHYNLTPIATFLLSSSFLSLSERERDHKTKGMKISTIKLMEHKHWSLFGRTLP